MALEKKSRHVCDAAHVPRSHLPVPVLRCGLVLEVFLDCRAQGFVREAQVVFDLLRKNGSMILDLGPDAPDAARSWTKRILSGSPRRASKKRRRRKFSALDTVDHAFQLLGQVIIGQGAPAAARGGRGGSSGHRARA